MLTHLQTHFSSNKNNFEVGFKTGITTEECSIEIDPTLTKSGMAADAKVVGDALAEKQPKGEYISSINGKGPDENGNIFLPEGGGGIKFTTDETLNLSNEGVLSVNTAKDVEMDNTLPITSAAVYTQIGNIEVILGTI